jgi:tetratricopeptide (TPR) repeat protein
VDKHPHAGRPIRAEKVVYIEHADVKGDLGTYMEGGSERIPVHKPPRNLPPRQGTFAGRVAELADLHTLLSRGGELGITQQAAVHGYGGVGKTSLAVEYAWRQLADYPGGAFFLACEAALGAPPLHVLAPHLGLSSLETEEETAQRVKAHLETGEPCLLILDNVEGPRQWRDPAWSKDLPAGACRRLVTTRAERLPELRMYALQRLTTEDGLRLLTKYRADVAEHREVAAAVVEWFDGLAVGLTVVGAYMQLHPDLTWEQYARSLEAKGLGAVRQTEAVVEGELNYEARVDAVLDDLLASLPAEERRGIEYAALLPEDNVYVPWLSALLQGDSDIQTDELPGYEGRGGEGVVQRLLRRQMLRARGEEAEVVGLHRVLRRRVRERLREEEPWGRLVERVAALAEERGEASHEAVTNVALRRELTPLIALCEELEGLKGVEAAASAANWLATPLRALGRFREARVLLERFATEERMHALPARERALLFSNLALLLKDLGELGEARRRMEHAIETEERQFDPDHPTLAVSYSNLATILKDLGQVEQARRLMERAIEIDEKHFDPDHPTLANRYSNIAAILRDLGELEDARRRMDRAIEIDERYFDPDHPTLAIRYSNMATILKDLGELGAARGRMERAIEIEERHFDPDHPTLAVSYSNLAGILLDLGELSEARRRMERAVEISERHFDPDHPTLAVSYSNLAGILLNVGELGEARRRLERAIEISQRHFDPDHPTLAVRYNNLAYIELAAGDRSLACELFRRAHGVLQKNFPPSYPRLRALSEVIHSICSER